MDPGSRAARWCVSQYYAELARRFDGGFDPAGSIAVDDDELLAPRGVILIASVDGQSVACGAVKVVSAHVGWLKRMWVDESARGLGLGRRMLHALEAEARELGLSMLQLETNGSLVEAIHLYRSSGYVEVAPFNAEPYAHCWFEKHMSS